MQRVWLFLLLLATLVSSALSATRTVCATGATYTTIQAAITAASNGDTIAICAGTYNEAITINKSNLVLMGTTGNRSDVVIQNSTYAHAITIDSWPSSVVLQDLSVVQNRLNRYGIYISTSFPSNGITFENISVTSQNDSAIYFAGQSSNVKINNAYLRTVSDGDGIELVGQNNNGFVVSNTTIDSAEDAIQMYNTFNGGVNLSDTTLNAPNGIALYFMGHVYNGLTLSGVNLEAERGLYVAYSVTSGMNLTNTTIVSTGTTAYNDGVYIGLQLNGGVNISSSKITSSRYGMYFANAVTGGFSMTDVTIDAYNTAINFVNTISGGVTMDTLKLTSEDNRGIYFGNDVYDTCAITKTYVVSENEAIYFDDSAQPTISLSAFHSRSDNGAYFNLANYNALTITHSCFTTEDTSHYALNLAFYQVGNVNVSSSCFYATASNRLAYAQRTGSTFSGNYWNGVSGSYSQNNISDTSVVSVCSNNCSGTFPSATVNYRMDECSWKGTNGEVKDSSGNEYNATAKGAVIPQVSSQVINNGALFQRANQQYVELPTLQASKPNFNDGFTVTAWAKFSGTAGSWERIFDFGNGTNSNNIFLGREGTSTNLMLGIHESSSGSQYLPATGAISDTNWHLWAVTCSGATCTLYKDGVALTSSSSMKIPSNIARTKNYIGKSNWSVDAYLEGGVDELKVFDESLSATQIATIYTNELAKKNYDGTARTKPLCNVCQSIKSLYSTTSDGYYYVSEAIATPMGLQPFEIYCGGMSTDDNITQSLPTVINQSNSSNSNFKFNTISNTNYYTSTDKTYFSKIGVDENLSATTQFMTTGFSSINLVGTPFQIDFANTTLATCDSASDTSKLRIGHFSQGVKINTKVETKNYCTASKMTFKQIPNYYAKDAYLNYTTCAQIAQNSSTRPPSGYYLLRKPKQTTGEGNYVVAYCEMNPPVANQIWTLFLALDGQTTDQKSDVVNGNDTCSKVGYSFFTPNQKTVMEAARLFLYGLKSEWSDYTGTVREYFTDYNIAGWATNTTVSVYKPDPIPDGPMWPYGPFGIYKATSGASNGNKKMAMSTTFLSTIDKNDGFGSLDEQSWKSVLPEINANYSDTWWVADIAAGYARNATGHLVSVTSSIEPNGDYDANNWLGWFADANGSIIHYNDQNGANRYRYSNYMCTSKDMYNVVETSWDTWGFDAWDTSKSVSLRTISTKKVSENFDLTIASLNAANTGLSDFNGTVCVRIVNDQNISLNGNGSTLYFSNVSTKTLSNLNITKALKDARVLLSWKANINTTCPLSADANKTLATDNFAIRPESFSLSNPSLAYAGDTFTLDVKALSASNANSTDYNEAKDSSFAISSSVVKTGCENGVLSIPSFSFTDGQKLALDANYTDVGDVNITIAEKSGSEFAKVDSADTSDTNRFITPASLVVSVLPYELNVTDDTNFTASTGKEWLYDANVSDMYVTAKATVQANNKAHVALQNFTSACYAQPVNLTFHYDVNNTNSNVNLSYVTLQASMPNTSKLIADVNKTMTIPATSFTTASASAEYRFNVDRTYRTPLNPISMTLKDVNVTSTEVAKDENGKTLNQNRRFYYGRIKTKDITTDKTIAPHLLHVEIYSTSPLSGFYQNSLNWYIHANDGLTLANDVNLTAYQDFTHTTPTALTITGKDGFTNGLLGFNLNNLTNIKGSTVHLSIPSWLWYSTLGSREYNATQDCSYHPCFEYKFLENANSIGIKSGELKGATIGKDYNATYQKSGVKTFR